MLEFLKKITGWDPKIFGEFLNFFYMILVFLAIIVCSIPLVFLSGYLAN